MYLLKKQVLCKLKKITVVIVLALGKQKTTTTYMQTKIFNKHTFKLRLPLKGYLL